MSRIRILHIITQLTVGGAERQLLTLCNQLPRDEFECRVISLVRGGALIPDFEAAGVSVVVLDRRDTGGPYGQLIAIIREIRAWAPQILQTWLQKANQVGRIAAWLAASSPVVANCRDMGFMAKPADTWLDSLLDPSTSLTLHNSASGRQSYLRRLRGAARVRHGILPNGIDCAKFSPDTDARAELRRELTVAEDAPVAIMVARLHPIKDPQLYLAVARKVRESLPAARFWLVGGGPLEAELRAALAEKPDPGIWIAGERDDVPRLLKAADLALLTSSSEGLSNTILEAMSCGLAVVAGDVGGNAELVRNGATGLLFRDREPRHVAQAVERLLLDNPLRSRMGAAGRQRVEESYSLAKLVENAASSLRRLHRE